jgi:hypothetical protein
VKFLFTPDGSHGRLNLLRIRIQVFWDDAVSVSGRFSEIRNINVPLSSRVKGSMKNVSSSKKKAPWSFEKSETTHNTTQ